MDLKWVSILSHSKQVILKATNLLRIVILLYKDNLPPVWYIQDGVSIKLVPPNCSFLTQQQIVDLIIATGQLNITISNRVMFKD